MPAANCNDRADLGVLFVSGIAHQRPGSAVGALSGALYSWLLRWNCRAGLCRDSSPTLRRAVLSSGPGASEEPPHLSLDVPLALSNGPQDACWMLAESSWQALFDAPRFLDVTRWIWKVSTCLLVLQFVIPMRRNFYQARSNPAGLTTPARLMHGAAALCYTVLMCLAAMGSVLLSILLLALSVAAKLPVPRIELAVRWVVVKISSVLGDSYVLAHCPVQFAAMRTKVASDLRWLQERCTKVVIVAHSQGAAIAHQVLKDHDYDPAGMQAFITLGQGIAKMHILQRLDWDPKVHRAAWWSRLLVTTGMAGAGFPAFAVLASRQLRWPVLTVPASVPWSIVLIIIGWIAIASGVICAIHAVHTEVEQDVCLPAACSQFSWIDYYASADPVSNGSLIFQPAADRQCTVPGPCDEVCNFRSLFTDHNGYLRNQDELLSRLLNDLVAAAYGQRGATKQPQLVSDEGLTTAIQHRRGRIGWLTAARIATAALGIMQFIYLPAHSFDGPLNRLVHTIVPHVQMDDTLARLAAALVVMIVFYAAAVLIWHLADTRAMLKFLATTPFCGKPGSSQSQGAEPAGKAAEATVTAAAA
jgi:hypothetical protein